MAEAFDSLKDEKLIRQFNEGAVGIIPTDTVYGLACKASDKEAVKRLYKLKDRASKPGTVIAASTGQLIELGIKPRYLRAVEYLWPSAISIVIPCSDPSFSYLRQDLPDIAVRVSADKTLNTLLRQTGPLLTSSANPQSKPPAGTIEDAQKYFGDSVDFYVDGGDLSNQKPSTIIRIIDDAVEVLRQGAVTIDESGRLIN